MFASRFCLPSPLGQRRPQFVRNRIEQGPGEAFGFSQQPRLFSGIAKLNPVQDQRALPRKANCAGPSRIEETKHLSAYRTSASPAQGTNSFKASRMRRLITKARACDLHPRVDNSTLRRLFVGFTISKADGTRSLRVHC